ncbi:esterase-like activity of phytase family protein [Mangrovicoccus algicola]|uniref:Esterase-like activity of phytase family protein n=1 Tax=Mangrovicoccus algicola TaxID=2771008 RepID=A0A8J6YS64_9RHOB|nr:esterase-like activity of phytase family protein [Mangrovicoccus algicola]MBE3636677.1 esterase-like activity of phytase family protein [Mangrovicoccus algicola]
MTRTALTALATLFLAVPALADDDAFPAILEGHAILPAQTLIPAPEDAPAALQVSGKYTSLPRLTAAPTDGAELPFAGQPVQGFSGIQAIGDGSYYVLTDNGFGSKKTSPDTMLFFHVVRPDWDTGEVAVEKTTFLSDPDRVIWYPIAMEGTETRYLTGSDLDLEGFQVIDGKIFIGEEFGPFVIVADAETGVVEEIFETTVNGVTIRSPDNPALVAGNPDKPDAGANLNRSKGFEGFAAAPDGSMIYGLLEGPVWDAESGSYETVDGTEALRIVEFDVAARGWTGRSFLYPLEADGHAIGDFNMIDETRGLVIERDNGQGDAALACAEGESADCFEKPALFKRVYLIDMAGIEDGQPVRKLGHIDLLDIRDPEGVARQGGKDGVYTMPFVTIENVDIVDDSHIIVGNDNNFPFSKGRDLVARDDNELVLLDVAEFLKAGTE